MYNDDVLIYKKCSRTGRKTQYDRNMSDHIIIYQAITGVDLFIK